MGLPSFEFWPLATNPCTKRVRGFTSICHGSWMTIFLDVEQERVSISTALCYHILQHLTWKQNLVLCNFVTFLADVLPSSERVPPLKTAYGNPYGTYATMATSMSLLWDVCTTSTDSRTLTYSPLDILRYLNYKPYRAYLMAVASLL